MTEESKSSCCHTPDCCDQSNEKHLGNCMVCGIKLIYQTHSKEVTCSYCGKTSLASICCPEGHFICDECHGAGFSGFLEKKAIAFTGINPMEIAETLLQGPFLPSLGAEHHSIVTVALLSALKNYGEVTLPHGSRRTINDKDILEGIRRMKKIPSCTCAFHGACGAGLGAGAAISILFDATCAKDIERTLSMRAASAALTAIANCGGPGCCKQSVRMAILAGVEILKELCRVKLPISRKRCFHTKDTSHGCKGIYCQFNY